MASTFNGQADQGGDNDGLPCPFLLSPAPSRHSLPAVTASPMRAWHNGSPRKRLFEGSSSPPPSPSPVEKSPYRLSLLAGSSGFRAPNFPLSSSRHTSAARSWSGGGSAAKRLRLDLGEDHELPAPPLRMRRGLGEKEGVASVLLSRAKPDLFSEDSDAAVPGSAAFPDALSSLLHDERAAPAISVTPATPHGATTDALTPVMPSADLTPPSSPQPLSRHLHSTPAHATPLHLPCNVNPFSPERILPRGNNNVLFSPAPSPCPSPARIASRSERGSRYLDDFEEIEKIGTGSFSKVFKARNRVDGWLYAIKQAKRAFSSVGDKHNTLKEVYALAALGSHPHVVRYYSAWVEAERLYIQTEYCSGGSLADHLKRGVRFTEAQLIDILRQVALGLSHIHKKRLVHLDVKPENIYVDPLEDGAPPLYKIGDLGLISLADSTEFSEGDSRYISRDLFASDVDCRKLTKADIFSLGCSVYELALGKPLPSRGEEWNAIREGDIQLSSDFSKPFVDLLKLMMAADADKRPSADELLQSPVLCSGQMKWDVEHKKRLELEEDMRVLRAELEWRRSVMESSGWQACERLVPVVDKLERYLSYLAPASSSPIPASPAPPSPSPLSAESSPRPGV